MSILGYSSSYFLPEYWANTPLYGEKIIPLIDYILSDDYTESDKLAGAFYDLANKYKNTPNLPLDKIEAIIEESGYGYIRDLLGRDEDSIRLLVSLLVLIHDLKSSDMGIRAVINLLQTNAKAMVLGVAGSPTLSKGNIVSNITDKNYVYYTGFSPDDEKFELKFKFKTSDNFDEVQCISSGGNYCYALNIGQGRKLHLYLGNNGVSWNICENVIGESLTLQANTTYYVKLAFDGSEYTVTVSLDDKKYDPCIELFSAQPLNKTGEIIYIGVDKSSGTPVNPFSGSIDLGPFVINVDNLTIEQWFEHVPVEEENTYSIKAELDITLISSDFFEKFVTFANKYVYPTLKRFEAKFGLENNLTILPYSRQKIRYIATNSADQDPSLDPYIVVNSIEILKNYRYPRNVKYLSIQTAEDLMGEGLAQTLSRYTDLEEIYYPNLRVRQGVTYEIPSIFEGRSDLTIHLPEGLIGYIENNLSVSPTILYDILLSPLEVVERVNEILDSQELPVVDEDYSEEEVNEKLNEILEIEE